MKNWTEEFELKIQNILEPYFVVLDGRDNDEAVETLIEISKKLIKPVIALLDQQKKEIEDRNKSEVDKVIISMQRIIDLRPISSITDDEVTIFATLINAKQEENRQKYVRYLEQKLAN